MRAMTSRFFGGFGFLCYIALRMTTVCLRHRNAVASALIPTNLGNKSKILLSSQVGSGGNEGRQWQLLERSQVINELSISYH